MGAREKLVVSYENTLRGGKVGEQKRAARRKGQTTAGRGESLEK